MTVLIIDTSTERGLVALGNEMGVVTSEKRLPPGYQNSDYLFPALQALNVDFKELTLIVCAVGPGSFTGIRVGAAVAKALSFSLHVPLIGVNTLKGFPLPALIDAKSGGAYVLDKDTWLRLPLEAALEKVGHDKVYTPNASQLRLKALGVEWVECYPSAEKLLHLGVANKTAAQVDGSLSIEY